MNSRSNFLPIFFKILAISLTNCLNEREKRISLLKEQFSKFILVSIYREKVKERVVLWCVCVFVYIHVYMHVEARGQHWVPYFLLLLPIAVFETETLTGVANLTRWLPSILRKPTVPALVDLGTVMPSLYLYFKKKNMFMCLFKCITHDCSAYGSQMRVSNTLKAEIQATMSPLIYMIGTKLGSS